MPESIAYNVDCMEYMRTLPDNAFDLAVIQNVQTIRLHGIYQKSILQK